MAGPSPSWQTVNVRGTYRRFNGTPCTGSVSFTVGVRVIAAGDLVIFPKGAEVLKELDSSGSFSVDLPATDDPDIFPTSWTYSVTENLQGGGGETYTLALPLSLNAVGGLDLVSVLPPATVPPTVAPMYRGVPGGLATLGVDGKVPATQLPAQSGGAPGVDYTWIQSGTQAQRVALDVTQLRPGTIFDALDGDATGKTYILLPDKTWFVFAAGSHHNTQHKTGGVDPLTAADVGAAPSTIKFADVGAAPATGITLDMLSPDLQAMINNAGQSSSTPVTVVQTTIPLAAGDTFRSSPVSTTGSTLVKAYVLSDRLFTARLDTSTNGITFTVGSPTYAAALVGSDYAVLAGYPVTTPYVRLVVICGSNSMARLSASIVTLAVSETTIGSPA